MAPLRLRHHGNAVQRYNWRRILGLLRSENLLAGLQVAPDIRIRIQTVDWERYWAKTECRLGPDLTARLEALRSTRRAYIESGFALDHAAPYCYSYFRFLQGVLESVAGGHADMAMLHATVGLECTAVGWAGQPTPLAAVTCNVRNPVYMLAKLREPQAYEDPKFLPLMTTFPPSHAACSSISLFYHYRQLAPGRAHRARVLLCPPAAADIRVEAFGFIHALAAGLTRKHDTRVRQRSQRLCDLAIGPLLTRLRLDRDRGSSAELRIADLGAGSGDLTRGIIRRLTTHFAEVVEGRRFALTMVDLAFHNQMRHVRHRPLFRGLSSFRCCRSDYVAWIDSQQASADGKLFDIVLICRLLNNASRFSICWADDWHQVRKLAGQGFDFRDWKAGAYLPHNALSPSATCTNSLVATNAAVRLHRGTTFRQLSLSDYYRALYLLAEGSLPANMGREAIFFPVRQFDDSSLILSGGESALSKLCLLSQAVIIEDVDLNAQALRRHMETHGLHHLAASDVTDRSQMHTANLLCVSQKSSASFLPGRRVW